jgi:hypothetical protein
MSMTDGHAETAALDDFASVHGLEATGDPRLPAEGDLLGRDNLVVHAAIRGQLPGEEPGTLAHLSYTYRSNDTTHTAERTAVVLRVPESIGFAPYLGSGGAVLSTKSFELEGGGSVRAADGIDDAWLREVFSPALSDWLERSPDDFEWELSHGVLCASRGGYLTKDSDLARLCTDAAHLAMTIREQSLQEVDSGQASRTAAKGKEDGESRLTRLMLPLVKFDQPPADIAAARPRFRELVVRHPSTYLVGLFMTLAITLAVNIIGGGIFGLLLNLPSPGRAVLIFEAIVIGVVGYFTFRAQIRGRTATLAKEAFWVEYARSRRLRVEDPLRFAATHAKAELPGSPVRVMSGRFGDLEGALMITGDGFKRGDSIALVAGEDGPVASADFEVSAPGVSAEVLDSYSTRLAAELKARAP